MSVSGQLEYGVVRAGESHGPRFWTWMISFLVLTTMGGALVGSAIGFLPLLLGASAVVIPTIYFLLILIGVFTPVIGRLSDLHGFQRSFSLVAIALLVTAVLCGGLLAIFRGAGSEAIAPSPAAQQET